MNADLSGADLIEADLGVANLREANLRGADLGGADLIVADLSVADLSEANLRRANLGEADLGGASLNGADLIEADLSGANLGGADLRGANLGGANLSGGNLGEADLRGANLGGVNLRGAYLGGADLTDGNLGGADLIGADLSGANLRGANLREANLRGTYIGGSYLRGADFSAAKCYFTRFINVDLSKVTGLESIEHEAPSSVGIDTLSNSKGSIPEGFLRGCGLAPWEVLIKELYVPELTPAGLSELQYQIFDAWTKTRSLISGCFISYASTDASFAEKLRNSLLTEGINVWLDRHDGHAGELQHQIWRAIQVHRVVLLVLSEQSVKSDWVENELEMVREKEKSEGHPVLCPIALDDAWKAKVGAKDGPGDPTRYLWRTVKQKLVIDFSKWKTRAFNTAFKKLLRGLKVDYR